MEDRVSRALRRAARILTLAALAACAFVAPAGAQEAPAEVSLGYGALSSKERVLWQRLGARVQALGASLDGVVGVAVKDVASGATLELRAGEVFPTASVIKVAVLYELYRQAEAGRLELAAETRPPLPRAGGGGVLQELSGQVSLTWRDLAVLMMGWSDNAATNVLIDRVGMAAVEARLRELGLGSTRLRRRMMDVEAARRGDENVSSPADLVALMEVVHRGTGLSRERARDLLAVASVPKSAPFREALPETLRVADKPGDLEGVRAAAAVVELPGRPYAAGIMTGYLRHDPDGDAVIRDLSRALYETFDRLARASEYGRLLK
jgi:beta-lactamase class A